MKKFDYITPIKAELEKNMHQHCQNFMLIGFPIETPRFYNFYDFDHDTKILSISSTQKLLGFKVQTDFDHVCGSEFWQQFKEFRTEFLLTHYPTINPY